MKATIRRVLENRWFNLLVLILSVVSLVSVFLEIMIMRGTLLSTLDRMEIFILAFFALEFILSIYTASSISEYLLEGEGLVDLLSILSGLSFIQAFSAIRTVRALRAIRIFKVLGQVHGKVFNAIILIQVTLALVFSFLILNTCKIRADNGLFVNLQQLLFILVLSMILATAFVVQGMSYQIRKASEASPAVPE